MGRRSDITISILSLGAVTNYLKLHIKDATSSEIANNIAEL